MAVLNRMTGALTPVGIMFFVAARLAKLSFEQVTRSALPGSVPPPVLILVTIFPELVLWLPRAVLS